MASDRAPKLDLMAFRKAAEAASKKTGTPCSVCALPKDVRKLAQELRAEGKSWAAIAAGLKALDFHLPYKRLVNHFQGQHEERLAKSA